MSYFDTYTTPSDQKINLRLLQKEDVALLVDLFYRLSSETKRLRFHLYTTKIPEARVWEAARQLSILDPQRQVAIVATIVEEDEKEQVVGVAQFARKTTVATEAEIAVVVRDDFQRRGLGKHMLIRLAERARALGIVHFTAWIMTENVRLMKLIRSLELESLESDPYHRETKIRIPLV